MDALYAVLGLLTEPWALVAIAASFLFASENHIDELLLRRLGATDNEEEETDAVGTLVIISGLFGLLVSTLFGTASFLLPQAGDLMIGSEHIVQSLIIGALDMVWLIPYLYATRRSGALEAAPLFQLIPVIALGLGVAAFSELPPTIEIIGALTIVCGGFALNIGEVEGKWKVDIKTIALMLFASTVIALISFLFRDTARETNFVATAFWSGIGMCLGGSLVFIVWQPYRKEFLSYCRTLKKADLAIQATNEVTDIAAMALQRLALVLGPSVMTVEALNAYQPLFILIIGTVLAKRGTDHHREKLEGNKFYLKTGAIVLIALGTIFIAL
jgi:hypothetical protein